MKGKNYPFGAAAGAIAGFLLGIVQAVILVQRTSPDFLILFVAGMFQYAGRGALYGVLFVWVSDKIPIKRTLVRAVVFSIVVELLLRFGLFALWYLLPMTTPFPFRESLIDSVTFLLWGVCFGFLLEHPHITKRLDFIRP